MCHAPKLDPIPPPGAQVCPPLADSGSHCIRCDYNLTGLTSDRCPECGWTIDWEQVWAQAHSARIGTPVYRARGWRKIDQTLVTLAMMLFLPWRFAHQLRANESVLPGLVIATISMVIMWMPESESWYWLLAYTMGIGAVMVSQTAIFASMHLRSGQYNRVAWFRRARLWLVLSLYSTCFVAAWRLIGEPPVVADLTHANFYPFADVTWLGDHKLGVSVIYYWWIAILTIFFATRSRPRVLVVLVPPILHFLAWVGVRTAAVMAP